MKRVMWKLSAILHGALLHQEGQDLIEYALLAALISLGAVTTLGTLSNSINSAFSSIGNNFNANV